MTHPVHQPHDKGYKYLLKNNETFLQLLQNFVPAPWVRNIDPQSLILVDKSYITQEFADKEADIVYRLKSTAGDVIFYVLLELQSTVDYLMPFRLLLYMVEIWREVFNNTPQNERESKHFRLPAIIPWCCKLSVRLDSNYILLGNSVRTGAICRVSSQLSL